MVLVAPFIVTLFFNIVDVVFKIVELYELNFAQISFVFNVFVDLACSEVAITVCIQSFEIFLSEIKSSESLLRTIEIIFGDAIVFITKFVIAIVFELADFLFYFF